MKSQRTLVITTIHSPTRGIRQISRICRDWRILVVADQKTPPDWHCPGVEFLSLERQQQMTSALGAKCPWNHYGRKNLGYLEAMRIGAPLIAETDDDNLPYPSLFLSAPSLEVRGQLLKRRGWINVYRFFTPAPIWPRGFPLELIASSLAKNPPPGRASRRACPIQQFLADGDPDVDAIYRLTCPRPTRFKSNCLILAGGTFSPFNSQNTVWWPPAYPLMYLPVTVSFRMTDIWRSFVAQICLYRAGLGLAFQGATVFQARNVHSLMRDFEEELPGYRHNRRILDLLGALALKPGSRSIGINLYLCYEALVAAGIVAKAELKFLKLWLKDLAALAASPPGAPRREHGA